MPGKEFSKVDKRKVVSQEQLNEEGSSLSKKEAEHRRPEEMGQPADNTRGAALAKQPRPQGLESALNRNPDPLYQDLASIRKTSNPPPSRKSS
jgi:hypothetical protein